MMSEQRPYSSEQGSLIVLLALLSLTIFGLIAFAIDATIAASARAQHSHTAENAALGALEEYLAYARAHPTDPSVNIDALSHAALRASEIAKMNINVSAGRPFFTDPTKPQHALGPSPGLSGADPLPSGAENGTLVPGTWYFVEPKPPAAACGSATGNFKPCFVPLDPNERANAIRVELHLNDHSPLGTIFARALGQRSLSFSSASTASLVPRRAVFLVDLSPSIYRDTHLHFSFQQRSAQYALALTSGAYDPVSKSFVSNWQDYLYGPGTYDLNNPTPYGPQGDDESSYKIMQLSRPSSQTKKIPTEHYRDEYTPVAVTSVSPPDLYAIDRGRRASEDPARAIKPQPLTDVLTGIHLAMRRFNERSVPADMLSIIGFDDAAVHCTGISCSSPRVMPLTTPNLTSGIYASFFHATDPAVEITDQQKLNRYLFPRRFNDAPGHTQPPASDLRSAVQSAAEMLKEQADFKVADNFIVMFSDGKNNCLTDEEVAAQAKANPGQPPPSRCSNTETYFHNTFGKLREQLENDFGEKRISFHMILVGKDAGPHTLLLKSPTGGCMSDSEARSYLDPAGRPQPLPFISPNDGITDPAQQDWTWTETDTKLYYPVNQLYYGTVATRGLYLPLRPCCTLGGAGCDASSAPDIATKLNALCSQAPAVGDIPPAGAVTDNPALNSMIVMPQGRLLCDPGGRSPGQQITQAIEQIMSQNPFVLVE